MKESAYLTAYVALQCTGGHFKMSAGGVTTAIAWVCTTKFQFGKPFCYVHICTFGFRTQLEDEFKS